MVLLWVKGSGSHCPVVVSDWDPVDRSIRTLVNVDVRQGSKHVRDDLGLPYPVADLARTMTLLPGDLDVDLRGGELKGRLNSLESRFQGLGYSPVPVIASLEVSHDASGKRPSSKTGHAVAEESRCKWIKVTSPNYDVAVSPRDPRQNGITLHTGDWQVDNPRRHPLIAIPQVDRSNS